MIMNTVNVGNEVLERNADKKYVHLLSQPQRSENFLSHTNLQYF